MNTEVTQTQGEGDKQGLARYEYRSHTNSRRGEQTAAQLGMNTKVKQTQGEGCKTETQLGMNTEVTQTLGEGDKQDLAMYEYRSLTNSMRGRQTVIVQV